MKGYTSAHPLFDAKPAPPSVEPVDPSVLESDVPRLKGAALRVLARLKAGPATNLQLMQPECGGARFGGRLHDLRKVGVIWKREHVEGSVWSYRLIQCPVELQS
jgi:hypothetical protein